MNKAVAAELTALHQYMYFHFHLEDAGYDALAKYFHRISIAEMIHVEQFAERILFLKGDVKMVFHHPVKAITDVKEMLKEALALETQTVADYNAFAQECAANGDAITKKLFEDILAQEEEHQDNFDTELENYSQFGDQYLALQAHDHTQNIAKGKEGGE